MSFRPLVLLLLLCHGCASALDRTIVGSWEGEFALPDEVIDARLRRLQVPERYMDVARANYGPWKCYLQARADHTYRLKVDKGPEFDGHWSTTANILTLKHQTMNGDTKENQPANAAWQEDYVFKYSDETKELTFLTDALDHARIVLRRLPD